MNTVIIGRLKIIDLWISKNCAFSEKVTPMTDLHEAKMHTSQSFTSKQACCTFSDHYINPGKCFRMLPVCLPIVPLFPPDVIPTCSYIFLVKSRTTCNSKDLMLSSRMQQTLLYEYLKYPVLLACCNSRCNWAQYFYKRSRSRFRLKRC